MGANFPMLAKTLYGFEDILAKELRNLGASGVRTGNRSVFFEGDTGFMYKANLCLRTALRILKPVKTFKLRDQDDLYKGIRAIPWEKHLKISGSLVVDSVVKSDLFSHSQYVSQKSKDAIVDRFRDRFGKRPNVDFDRPDLRIHVHIQGNICHVSLDSSGGSLHLRGYRTITNIAPLNEVLAAGLLLLAGWDGRTNFLDPMCGSGTLAIEAAMIACNIPANINRKYFGFQTWPDYDAELFDVIKNASLNKTRGFDFKIFAWDKAPSAIRKSLENIANANLSEFIAIEQRDFFKSQKPGTGKLTLVTNPPYGERLPIAVKEFYSKIGDTLKQEYAGTNAWILTANPEGIKSIGLRTSRKIKVFNSNLESRLILLEIYEGSKKKKPLL